MDNNTTFEKKGINLFSFVLVSLAVIATAITLFILIGIIVYIFVNGIPYLTWSFLTSSPSYLEGTYGILPQIINTVYLVVLTLIFALPTGIGTALYLTEYSNDGPVLKLIRSTVEILAGIPSIVYGLFGMIIFVGFMKLNYSIIAGSLTMAIMVLPTVIRTTEEALKSIDPSYKEAATSFGVSRFYLIRTILVPCAMPGIVVSVILSIGRIVGESAALLFTSSIAYDMPKNVFGHIFNSGGSLTVQLYLYATEGSAPIGIPFAIAAIIMILVFILNMSANGIAKLIKK